ncbi:MAG: PAS domain-containing protein [Deltaproteobacteria bacterium]|nr:PAS domain-containing protein [Deltaproteobacteria bacterium]
METKPSYEELEQRNRALEKEVEKLRQEDEILIESEMKYQVMLKNLPSVVFKGFKDWSVEFTDNKVESLTGYSQEEFNSKKLKWSDLILKEDIDVAKESLIEALKSRDAYTREYRVKTRLGEILWMQDRGQIIYDKNGGIKYIIGTFFDITDRKKAKETLKKQNKQLMKARKLASLGVLTAGVAHELNNPLNNISTSIQILLEELEDDNIEYKQNLLLEAESQVERAKNIIKALLEFSHEKSLSFKRVQLKNLVKNSIKQIKEEIPDEISINMNVPENIEANLDPKRVQQVLINLMLNGIQAMMEGGVLTIKAWERIEDDTKMLYFQVQDTGHGISKQDVNKIFDPFFTTRDVGQGSGLGLSISHSIIEQHGGRIEVEGVSEKGSKFTVILPPNDNNKN